MSHTVLLYGATGFSGALIAAEGERSGMATGDGTAEHRMILAGRDGNRLEELAGEYGMEYRAFGLDDRDEVRRGLRGIDVVINAAGPFARTADHLVRGTLDVGCHYVDINGELDVYKKLDDFGRYAEQRKVAMVCSAGHTAAASDLLLDAALEQLHEGAELDYGPELGAIRIAMSRVMNLSRGSAETVWRSLREQVTVVRSRETEDAKGRVIREPRLWHEPVGKLDRTFDFLDHRRGTSETDLRIASAANLVDTLTARLTVARRKFSAKRIESYVETGTAARIGYQIGRLFAPIAAIPLVQAVARQQIGFLPPGPTERELREDRQIVLLEIEDPVRTRVIDWRWETPNAYLFTARVALEIAKATTSGRLAGWLTPGQVLRPQKRELEGDHGAFRSCRLDERTTLGRETS